NSHGCHACCCQDSVYFFLLNFPVFEFSDTTSGKHESHKFFVPCSSFFGRDVHKGSLGYFSSFNYDGSCGANCSTVPAADAAEIAGLVDPYFIVFKVERGSFADFNTEVASLTLLIIDLTVAVSEYLAVGMVIRFVLNDSYKNLLLNVALHLKHHFP
ncbi:MAG: hypothetical protein WB014_15685, partial [Methanosarcina sp.]